MTSKISISKIVIILLHLSLFFMFFSPYSLSLFFLVFLSLIGFASFLSKVTFSLKVKKDIFYFLIFIILMHMLGLYSEWGNEYLPIYNTIGKVMLIIISSATVLFMKYDNGISGFIGKLSFLFILTLFVCTVINILFPLPLYLGQDYRGGDWFRLTGIYSEPGMLANVCVFFLSIFIAAEKDKQQRIKALFVSFFVISFSTSAFGLFAFLLLCLYCTGLERSFYLKMVFCLIILISILAFFTNYTERGSIMFDMIHEIFTYNGLSSYKNTQDGSFWLKLSNMECTFQRSYSDMILGEGIYGNSRQTYQNFRIDGRVDYSEGCAWVNSNGAIILWVYQYGLPVVAFFLMFLIKNLKVSSLLIFIVMLSRSGENPIFICLVSFIFSLLIYNEQNNKKQPSITL